ncbi:Phytoene dehydrogenase, chloroplastic/chromoplastic [Apostasia shenzhenica]|uniref:Phytoene dehydrogenase, chloroplastic/chromoplastic n=1 Tax=Apostasia shenzhenica TaxID=1088818 RepID=A0A2I0AX73_9ASPA|nr:Phytoene dehydrogenase, chloroplastic/chromoplastic [Apostasia shenzhenica]
MWPAPSLASTLHATVASPRLIRPQGFMLRAEASSSHDRRRNVVVIGAGWAGLASAHHLCKQGFDVTILGAGSCPTEEIALRGFWCPYHNIFSIIDELGIKPFTMRTKFALYTSEGVQFPHLSLLDRLTSIPLISAVIDFDNTDTAWRKYDAMTAKELLKQYGCSERLYREIYQPFIEVGLLAPAEQCSAATTLSMLYYYVLSHQQNFDVVWCRGTVQEKIFLPWLETMKSKGCTFHGNKKVTDFVVNESTGHISGVLCGQDFYEADAFVQATCISTLKSIVANSSTLQSRQEFLNILNLAAVDVVHVKIWLDRKVKIPRAINVCSGHENSIGWVFFDLNSLFDEYEGEPATVLEAEFYHANQLLVLKDEQIVLKLMSSLSRFIKELEQVSVVQQKVSRFPNSATHFFPELILFRLSLTQTGSSSFYLPLELITGSYNYMMKGSTSLPNLFMAGDWIITRHGSWSQEKAFVTGLQAANQVVDYFGEGEFARIIPVEDDEPHIETLRELNRRFNEVRE